MKRGLIWVKRKHLLTGLKQKKLFVFAETRKSSTVKTVTVPVGLVIAKSLAPNKKRRGASKEIHEFN